MTDGTSALVVPADLDQALRIRLARIAARKSLGEMAEDLGVSEATYGRIESGSRPVRRGELIAIAQITGQVIAFFGDASSAADEGGVLTHDEAARERRAATA